MKILNGSRNYLDILNVRFREIDMILYLFLGVRKNVRSMANPWIKFTQTKFAFVSLWPSNASVQTGKEDVHGQEALLNYSR